jgi:hypothetical protein
MTLPEILLVATDGATYTEAFTRYTDSVSVRCSAFSAPFTYREMCPSKVYKIYDEVTNAEITFPYSITIGPNMENIINVASTNANIQGVHNVYIRVSMPGTTSIEITSHF